MLFRSIKNKYKDPAVVCVDSTGRFVISVLSGHVGGANELTRHIAAITGGEAVITTQSDNAGLWALDTLAGKYGWKITVPHTEMNRLVTLFVNREPTALLLDIKDKGTEYLERTLPAHVKVFYHFEDMPQSEFKLIIAVTPYIYSAEIPMLCFHPAVLHLGIGCRKQCDPSGIAEYIEAVMHRHGLCPFSLASLNTIELKKDEPLLEILHRRWADTETHIYPAEELKDITVPHPSEKAFEVTGVYGVAESTALKSSGEGTLVLEKQKGMLTEGNHFTFAIAVSATAMRGGHIEIVGAGPGDPELISVRGKRMLEKADLARRSIKGIKGNHYAIYTDDLQQERFREERIIQEILDAMEKQTVEICYLPRIQGDKENVVGCTAVARIQMQDGQYLETDGILHYIERGGRLDKFSYFLLNQVCCSFGARKAKGLKTVPLAIQMTASQLSARNALSMIENIVEVQNKMDPSDLIIEVHERYFADMTSALQVALEQLCKRGYQIVISRFASHHTALHSLRTIPVKGIKFHAECFTGGKNGEREKKIGRAHV